MFSSATFAAALAALSLAPTALSVVNYPGDFIDPNYILDFKYDKTTIAAQQTIVQWANQLSIQGPWSVTNKKVVAPSGDVHDYMSWKPYFWPDCSAAGNTSVLNLEEMHKVCNWTVFDGKLNPDARDVVTDVTAFDDMSNALLFNALSWGITRSNLYAVRVVGYIDHWFLNERTFMNPNLNFAQMEGGPKGQTGSHTGVLDLKGMVKIASGVLLLRQGNAPAWNTTIDNKFQDWCRQYITWLTSNEIALTERAAENNHGTFYFAQLAALYVIAGDNQNAVNSAQQFFSSTFLNQIDANGNQPKEADRTRPYHYLTYNLAALVTLGRIAQYAGWSDVWKQTTGQGGTIPKALEYAKSSPVGQDTASELYPVVAAVAAIYGDQNNDQANWLNAKTSGQYVEDGSFFWNQPLSDNGLAQGSFITYAGATGGTATLMAGTRPTDQVAQNSAAKLSTSWLFVGLFSLAAWLF